MSKHTTPKPIFDTIENLENLDNNKYLPTLPFAVSDHQAALTFLKQYNGNKATFEAYRREVERLIQWAWYIVEKSILCLTREEIETYIAFCLKPPKSWVALKRVPRFIAQGAERIPNPLWRPFVATIKKAAHKRGEVPDKAEYQLSQKAVREIFTILGSFYAYLALDEKVVSNPIALIRQKSKYLQKHQNKATVMRLSEKQWQYCLEAAQAMAHESPEKHERTLFIMTALYMLYLRISELAASKRWAPQMNHFYQDSHGHWWFKTVGKGNKMREIAVSDEMLLALQRYRKTLGLSSLPSPHEDIPLISKERGVDALSSTRHIRTLVQMCFDNAAARLQADNFVTEAEALEFATVHWLRHTGISDDINKRGRPVAHVRDDAGHSSSAITDRYNDIELTQRHESARHKS